MTALTELLFDTVYFPRSPWTVVRWWEARRVTYNLAVGAAGVVTLAALALLGALPPAGTVAILVPAYAVLANLCYSLGAAADLAARRLGGAGWAAVGPTLFRYGLAFAVGLTLFPIPLALLGWLLRLLGVVEPGPTAS